MRLKHFLVVAFLPFGLGGLAFLSFWYLMIEGNRPMCMCAASAW